MGRIKKLRSSAIDQAKRLDFILSWGARLWRWLPAWAKTGIAGIITAVAAAALGFLGTAWLIVRGFVQQYWDLVAFMVLSGIGAAFLLRQPIHALVEALDRVAASRDVLEKPISRRETGSRRRVRALLEHIPEESARILMKFKEGSCKVPHSSYSGHPKGFDWLKNNYILEEVGDVTPPYQVWDLNPEYEDIVRTYFSSVKDEDS